MNATTSAPAPAAARYPTGKILLAGLLTIVASVAANYLIFWVATSLLGITSTFGPFANPAAVGLFTVIFLLIGILVWWFLARRSATPERTFNTVALIGLIVSLIPNVLFLIVPPPAELGVPTLASMLVLILMHVVTWLIAITLLPRFSRA